MSKIQIPPHQTWEELRDYLCSLPEGWGVHVTHCCSGHCKYGEVDTCPVATDKIAPAYKCEDCTCLEMNPGADKEAENWWNSLTPEQKTQVYLGRWM